MNYREALAWLYGTQRFGVKLGLENALRLFAAFGVDRTQARIIHVAGTNGKGSVCAMAASICTAQGYRTGLFTSPHLISFRERIRVDGAMIAEDQLTQYLTAIRQLISAWEPHPTFFEITTAVALRHFAETACDIAVLETGMGGRLDATNAVTANVSVITPIDYDHQRWLGDTIEQIAGEKAGIIKPGVPVVSAPQRPEVERVLRARASECDAPLEFVEEALREFDVALAGSHQRENAALAVGALCAADIPVSGDSIRTGLAKIDWPARFQRWNERVVIDGAHNPAGARMLVKTWRESFGDERATIIAAVLGDKDAAALWNAISPIPARVFLPAIRSERAMQPAMLRDVLATVSPELPVSCFDSFPDAFAAAQALDSHILITGSLHFAGEALAHLRGGPAYEECAQ